MTRTDVMNFDKISLFFLFFSLTCMNLPHLPMSNDGLLGFRFLNFSLSCSPSFLDLYVVGASRGALFEWFFHTLSVPEPTLVVLMSAWSGCHEPWTDHGDATGTGSSWSALATANSVSWEGTVRLEWECKMHLTITYMISPNVWF